jgi:NAD(P)-dependent dehydrogenase (short-subunit alcohol dehydrogenase family)
MRGAVLITGCSTGIGEAAAQHLASKGFQVYAGVRKEADAEHLERHVVGQCTPVLLDVADEQQVDEVVARIDGEVGAAGLHGVVNNAGIAKGGPLEYLSLADWRQQLDVNVLGVVAVTKACMPLLRRAPSGRIVVIGSMSGKVGAPLMAPYTASKFAVEGLADALRMELRGTSMHVSLIEPGAVRTAIWEKGRAEAARLRAELPPEALEHYGAQVDAIEKGIEMQDRNGVPPVKVAEAIEHALSADRPRSRYPVGKDAWAGSVISRVLPDRAIDAVVTRIARP